MSGSHYTYIPFFPDDKEEDPKGWEKEAQELARTLRLCVKCGFFRKFVLLEKETFWFYFSCPICKDTIKLPRKRNRIANSYDKKWK